MKIHPTNSYTATARMLHWLVAAAIVLQFVLAKMAEWAQHSDAKFQQLVLLANHKSVGITILMLAIGRVLWRLQHEPPPSVPMPKWQHRASAISHWSLYGLLFLMPLSGWLMSSAAAISVSWFNLFALPDLVGPSKRLEGLFHEVHEILGYALLLVAGVHIAAALKHGLIDKDGVLARISSTASLAGFAAVLAAGLFFLTAVDTGSRSRIATVTPSEDLPAAVERADNISAENTAVEAVPAEPVRPTASAVEKVVREVVPKQAAAPKVEAVVAVVPLWDIDYGKSHIQFTAEQAGADFDGRFDAWRAQLRFDTSNLKGSVFEVAIRVDSVATQDAERDSTLMDAQWFNGSDYPEVYYRAQRFLADDDVFIAAGEIVVKDRSVPAKLQFKVRVNGADYILDGTARLDRIALGIGTDEWENPEWIGQFVDVRVHVEATVSP